MVVYHNSCFMMFSSRVHLICTINAPGIYSFSCLKTLVLVGDSAFIVSAALIILVVTSLFLFSSFSCQSIIVI